tara:strand:+ start:6528 stop:7232 length:705 start_codon:yes stop_codon:yes gene_type:complete
MARTTKTTTKTETNAPTAQATPAPVVSVASVDEGAGKTVKKTRKVADKVPNKVVQETIATDLAVSDLVGENLVVENVVDFAADYLAKLQQITTLMSGLKNEYRTLEKRWSREVKAALKLSSKKKRKSGNRAPSGFVKPTKISNELASFLEKPVGTEMARTEVTRDINKYIRSNGLQCPTNGRIILADSALATLLKLQPTDELTYFNLQKYMSPHFAKAGAATAPITTNMDTISA